MDGRDSPLFLPGPPGHCCKIPSRLMANGQSMLRAQAGAAANENLDATTPGRERAWGAGAGCQAPTPAGFSLAPLNPSQQVHNTWAEGLRDRGRPGPASSVLDGMLFQGSKRAQGTDRCPSDCRPPRSGRERLGYRQRVLVISLHALHGWGCHPTRPESVSACRNTPAAPGITSQQDCSCWLCSWARRSRPEPLSLPFPAHATSRSQPQVAKR